MEKREAWKALRAVLHTVRDRLPLDVAVHFGAQLPMLIRGMYYEGWEPSKVPIKMTRESFLAAIQEKIVAERWLRAAAVILPKDAVWVEAAAENLTAREGVHTPSA